MLAKSSGKGDGVANDRPEQPVGMSRARIVAAALEQRKRTLAARLQWLAERGLRRADDATLAANRLAR